MDWVVFINDRFVGFASTYDEALDIVAKNGHYRGGQIVGRVWIKPNKDKNGNPIYLPTAAT